MTCETPSNNTSEAVMRNKRTKKSLFSDKADSNEDKMFSQNITC